jgi:hypothetical protein
MIHRAGQQDSRRAKSYGFDRLLMRSITQEMAGASAEIFSLPEEACRPQKQNEAFAILDPRPRDVNLEHFDSEEPCRCGAGKLNRVELRKAFSGHA